MTQVTTSHNIQFFKMVVGLLVGFIGLNVQASNEKRCIYRRRSNRYSNQKIFLSSVSYEQDFVVVEAFSIFFLNKLNPVWEFHNYNYVLF